MVSQRRLIPFYGEFPAGLRDGGRCQVVIFNQLPRAAIAFSVKDLDPVMSKTPPTAKAFWLVCVVV